MKELWRTLAGHRRQFLVILVLEAVTSGTEALLHPLLLKALFDVAVLSQDFGRFGVLGACYLLFGVTLNLAVYWVSVWRKRFENTCALSLEMELLDRTLGLDGRRISRDGHASYVSRVHNDVREGLVPAVDVSIRLARQATASVVLVGVLLYLSWQAGLILLIVLPPLVVVSKRIARRIEDNTGSEREAEARYVDTLAGTLSSFQALRGLSLLMPGTRATCRAELRRYLDVTFVNYQLGQKQRTLSDLVMNVSDTASLIVGAYFVFAGRLSFGGFLAFVNSLWRALTGIVAVINMIPELRRSSAVLQRIHALRESQTAPYHDAGPLVLVEGARVHYGDEVDVTIDDFELRPGEHVLLRGPNGCGKTTLLRVVAGTLAPDAGVVTLPSRVASLIAPVRLPPLPVRELVADERLLASMGLTELADQLPADLSSGQRQKVGVAALLCEDAEVYLVDEPFANLDAGGRDLVLRMLEERTSGRGLVVVHHGDEALDGRFDRVVTLQGTSAQGLA